MDYVLNRTIKEVAQNFESFSFNSAVARIMELVNAMYKYDNLKEKNGELMEKTVKNLLVILSPAAPHFTEELWEQIGEKYSIFNERYPEFDASKIVLDEVEIAVQINSKIVARLNVGSNLSNEEILKTVKSDEKISDLISGKTIVKEIVVPKRLVNLIVK